MSQFDDGYLEKESLTIGRLIGNDLVLNHRAVSRTHAGIKEAVGVFWLFNLSASNGTLLNGELVDKAPLADGDIVQIGPYLLRMNYGEDAFMITIEMEIAVKPLEGQSKGLQQTMLVNISPLASKRKPGSSGVKRVSGTGYLSLLMPAMSQQALEAYWAIRLREAGKVDATTPLRPKRNRQVGKIQFNWQPTLDLTKPWRKSYFIWAVIIVAALAGLAAFLYADVYSPGELSSSHRSSFVSARNIAVRPNKGNCSECHTTSRAMALNCNSCHTTQTNQTAMGFEPAIFDAHNRAGVGCIDCHTEHVGPKVEAGLRSVLLCSSCHNETYKIKEGPRAGDLLGEPHGGETGYPVIDGQWRWRGLSPEKWRQKNLPEDLATQRPADQFHLLHLRGRMQDKTECADCHTAPVGDREAFRASPRAECAKCHGVSSAEGGLETGKRNCYTCHQQHRKSVALDALLTASGENGRIKQYLDRLNSGLMDNKGEDGDPAPVMAGSGGASAFRHNESAQGASVIGGLPWYGWIALIAALPVIGFVAIAASAARRKAFLKMAGARIIPDVKRETTGSLDIEKLKMQGPSYPHPVIDPTLCIGCHACVEVCPHGVLAIANGIATPVALDQCMEDTSCQVECPTNPKACIVLNTTKVIPSRKVPGRDHDFMTRLYGVYLIGDVSGVPLIKNAINEGAQVINAIADELHAEGPVPGAEYDVAIIGAGPAGLSAAVTAKRMGLRHVVIEQRKTLATINAFPAGKELFFKPDNVIGAGSLPIPRASETKGNRLKETVLQDWMETIEAEGIEIREEEACKDIKRENGTLAVRTEKGEARERSLYRARRVILAIGNHGAPRRLSVPGEDLKIMMQPDPKASAICRECSEPNAGDAHFCHKCGAELVVAAPYLDDKVKYKLSNPDYYAGKKCLVVGGGNSAIEAAVALCGLHRDGDRITFTRNREVVLAVRSDFKMDLKFDNKMSVYDCIDAGRIVVFFETEVQEIKENEVILRDTTSKREIARLSNDYIFSFIGGVKPMKFLERLGIEIV